VATWVEVQNYLVMQSILHRGLAEDDSFRDVLNAALDGETQQVDVDRVLQLDDGCLRTLVSAGGGVEKEVIFSFDRFGDWLNLRALVGAVAEIDMLDAGILMGERGGGRGDRDR